MIIKIGKYLQFKVIVNKVNRVYVKINNKWYSIKLNQIESKALEFLSKALND